MTRNNLRNGTAIALTCAVLAAPALGQTLEQLRLAQERAIMAEAVRRRVEQEAADARRQPGGSAEPASQPLPTGENFDPGALRVEVENIADTRAPEPAASRLTVNLVLTGDGIPPVAVVRQVSVTRALDDRERPVAPQPLGSTLSSAMMTSRLLQLSSGRIAPIPLRATVMLSPVPRSVRALKVVEGTIEVFVPTDANGGLVRIPDILSHSGLLELPALARLGIEVRFFHDAVTFDQVRSQVTFAGDPPEFPLAMGYHLRDPSSRLAGFMLQDATGAPVRTNGSRSRGSLGGESRVILLSNPIPRDAQLVLVVSAPGAMKTVPFRFENVRLP